MNTEVLKKKLVLSDLTLNDLASFLGVDLSTLYRKLNGSSDFTRIEIQNISSYLKLSSDEVFDIFFANELA